MSISAARVSEGIELAGEAANSLSRHAPMPVAFVQPTWQSKDVQSLRPGRPLTSNILLLFFRQAVPCPLAAHSA